MSLDLTTLFENYGLKQILGSSAPQITGISGTSPVLNVSGINGAVSTGSKSATATASSPVSTYEAPAMAIGGFLLAGAVYVAVSAFLTPSQAAGLSLVIVLGALLYASKHGHSIFSTLGLEGGSYDSISS